VFVFILPSDSCTAMGYVVCVLCTVRVMTVWLQELPTPRALLQV